MQWNQVTWYSRLGAIILFIGVIPALAFCVGVQYQKYNQAYNEHLFDFDVSTEVKKEVQAENKKLLDEPTKEDWDTYNKAMMFSKEPLIFSSTSGMTVMFKDYLYQARNPGSNLYVNDIDVADIEGRGIANPYFSSENNLFNFQVISICGAGCINTTYYSLDLVTLSLTRINREFFPENDVAYRFGVEVMEQYQNATNTYNLHISERFIKYASSESIDFNINAESQAGPLKVNESYILNIKYDSETASYLITEILMRPVPGQT